MFLKNRNKIKLTHILLAILPGLLVVGFLAFANSGPKTIFDESRLPDSLMIINANNSQKRTIIAANPLWQCGDDLEYYGVDDEGNSISDYQYATVQIGNQCWFFENLRSTKYRDNTDIPNLTVNGDWEDDISGAYCWYNNDYVTYGSVYGALYNWYAGTNAAKLCPEGWRLPSHNDFTTLERQICSDLDDIDCVTQFPYDESTTGYRGTNGEGSAMASTTLWDSGNLRSHENFGASGLTTLPAGCRGDLGSFSHLSFSAYLWSDSVSAWHRNLSHLDSRVARDYHHSRGFGFSVRCLRD